VAKQRRCLRILVFILGHASNLNESRVKAELFACAASDASFYFRGRSGAVEVSGLTLYWYMYNGAMHTCAHRWAWAVVGCKDTVKRKLVDFA